MKKRVVEKPSYETLRDCGLMARGYAHELASGKKIPSLRMAQLIEGKTGYPAGAWRLAETHTGGNGDEC